MAYASSCLFSIEQNPIVMVKTDDCESSICQTILEQPDDADSGKSSTGGKLTDRSAQNSAFCK